MSKYKPHQTIEERVQKHIIIGILVIAFLLSAIGTFMILVLEQHHEMERETNKKYLNK